MSDVLEFTGERFTPECVREIRYEHLHRYAFAKELVTGLNVLDAACGEGYGSALLATRAARVTGIDRSENSIEHARRRYASANLSFSNGDCTRLPFANASFDSVVSFETIEHLQDQSRLLEEFRRVLKPDGFLLISSPDKAIYTDLLNNRNPFHVKELYRDEFESLLRQYFSTVRLWGQKLQFTSVIWSLDGAPGVEFQQERNGTIAGNTKPDHAPVYLVALCSGSYAALPDAAKGLSFFDDAGESVYRHYEHEIRQNIASSKRLINWGMFRALGERLRIRLADLLNSRLPGS